MSRSLQGKVALVTGGSRGIGAAIARRCSADGASVAITYSSNQAKADGVVAAIRRNGGKALAIAADGADAAAVAAAVNTTAKTFGRLDVLINNAGVATMAPIDEFSLEDYDRVMAINARAVFVACKEAARHLPHGGRIVTIGSVNAERMPWIGGAVYAMSKAAVAGLGRGLARDFAARGVTVNTVQPGPVDTDMNPAHGEFADAAKQLLALARYGTPDEVASLVAWLAGPESGYVTGATFTVDGGFLA